MSTTIDTMAEGKNSSMSSILPLPDNILQPRLDVIRKYVARPIPIRDVGWTDPQPCLVDGGCVLIGNKYHAADVENLLSLGVTAVLNCASGGISRLPVDRLKDSGIRYAFTNCKRDDYDYPLLHDKDGVCSQHLEVAKALYGDVRREGGKVLFFCVAGQNRSAALAVAVMMLYRHSLEACVRSCSKDRPFVLENIGFQKQLVELETILAGNEIIKLSRDSGGGEMFLRGTPAPKVGMIRTRSSLEREAKLVEIELLIPGLCTLDVKIPRECTIPEVKNLLIDNANRDLLAYSDPPARVAKSWVVLAMFGYDDMYDIPLETEALNLGAQLDRIRSMFNLTVVESDDSSKDPRVRWTDRCRFALVILSVTRKRPDGFVTQEPWKFVHEERQGAPATLLENTLMSTHLRAWDFVTGQAYASIEPIVFSFADDARDSRAFMKISRSAKEAQSFLAPGEGDILGMGANAIVHRVELGPTSSGTNKEDEMDVELSEQDGWDAAVKRPFSLSKMLRSLETSSEAGLAKRMRYANSLNSDGRVLSFYGLGVGLAANAYNENEYKFEMSLLAEYEEEFSTYTMRRFMEDYVALPHQIESSERRAEILKMQANFSLISVKVLLCSLLNAFRDLTLMGVMAFDFNHLNNVLVSRDHRTVRLIDIDGDSRGSIQFPSEYISGAPDDSEHGVPHKPSLDVDLNTVLPTVIEKLILGKGRGVSFVGNMRSQIWHAKEEDGKAMAKSIIKENFFPNNPPSVEAHRRTESIVNKVGEWFYSVLKKRKPWDNWTNDIYDAMRCIDHLPIS